jgi:tetratricopeptide (TPR) repeat protein
MDGRPWLEILDESVAVERITSWEEVPGEAGQHPPDLREDPSEAAEAIKHLVDLGYIEAPSADAEEAVRNCLRDQRTNLAVALSTSRRALQAIPLWQDLAEEYPEQPYYRYQLALVYRSLDMYAECDAAIATLPAEWQGTVEIQSMLARIALARGDTDRARSTIAAIQDSANLDPAMLNQVGQLLLDTAEWDEAQAMFERSLALLPENPIARDGLARLHLERDEFAEAAECALEAASWLHYFPAAHYHLGLALRGLGREEEAIQAFETSLALGHTPADVHLALASLYRTRNPRRAQYHAQFTGIR